MISQGIRIPYTVDMKLEDVLNEIPMGSSFHWSLLFIEGTPNPNQGEMFVKYKAKVNSSADGINISWEELNKLSEQLYQIFEVVLLGARDINLLHRYQDESEMYSTCDVVIDLIDCACWDVYSKNNEIIQTLQKAFLKTELLQI